MRKFSMLMLSGCLTISSYAQMKVGNNPATANADAVFEMESTNKGVLLPRVALTGTTSAAPLSAFVAGMVVYNTATAGTSPNNVQPGLYMSDGAKWMRLVPQAAGNSTAWNTTGNAGTGSSNFTGTTDNIDFIVKTNNTERLRLTKAGSLYGGANNNFLPDTALYGLAWGYRSLGTRSYSVAIGNSDTATGVGNGAWAIGYKVLATGDRSVALGNTSKATGNYSTAIGSNSSATGNYSGVWGNLDSAAGTGSGAWAIGTGNKAIGTNAVAIGTNTQANSNYSTAIGNAPAANGNYSMAMGNNTATNAWSMTAAGSYNALDSAANATSSVAKDPLFTVGNGTSAGARANALNVLKNGQVLINTSTSGVTGYAAPRADLDVRGTGAVIWPVGTTANRPATPVQGMVRFNTDSRKFEGYDGTAWYNME